jgi:hypothetical protein
VHPVRRRIFRDKYGNRIRRVFRPARRALKQDDRAITPASDRRVACNHFAAVRLGPSISGLKHRRGLFCLFYQVEIRPFSNFFRIQHLRKNDFALAGLQMQESYNAIATTMRPWIWAKWGMAHESSNKHSKSGRAEKSVTGSAPAKCSDHWRRQSFGSSTVKDRWRPATP